MFNKKFAILSLIIVFSFISIVGCSSGTSEKAAQEPATETQIETITISHELGEAVVDKNPERVIVFDYASLDSLDQMGVEILGLPKSNIPSYLNKFSDNKYEDVGTLFEPNFEKIYELSPDLIVISGRQREVYEELSKIAPTVYLVIDTQDYIGSFSENLNILGQIFDKEEMVENELNSIKNKMDDLQTRVSDSGENALIIMANDGALSAYGNNSRFNVIHNEFGFPAADDNIEVANHGQSVSFEYILEVNPDKIFVIDRAAVAGGSQAAENVLDNDIVKMTRAYQSDNIHYLNSHVWYVSSGGIQSTNIMIDEILSSLK